MTKFLFALALSLTAAPALAEPPVTATSLVNIADLNLSSKADQRTLDRRLSIAIGEVCGTASPSDLVGQNETRACRVATRERVASERDQRIAVASQAPIQVAAR